ncbi:MAG: thiamine phosphate synthase [Acidobacteriaceae bacterium]|nr:thiamine phosphate synthase [Acidobacteriaceae bacterium]
MPVPFCLPRFYPILDTAALATRGADLRPAAEGLLEAGVKILQYRHKAMWTQAHFDDAQKLARACEETGTLFVLNDRADFAHILNAALHVGQDDLPPVAARRVISDEVMGYSTHNRLQLTRGNDEPVEYLSIGPIFATASKERPDPVVGISALRELRPLTKKQLVGIGGITLENALEVLDAKVDSVAVISGVLADKSDRKSVRKRAEEWLRVTAAET